MANIETRTATAADLPHLMGLDHSSTSEYVWQLELRRETRVSQTSAVFREVRLPRPVALAYPNDPFALADTWKRKLLVQIATAGPDPIGYLVLAEPRPDAVTITDLAVAPAWRRKGAASALLDASHEWCRQKGYQKMFFEMQSKNHPAMMLAQKKGFEFCGYNDRYYSNQDIMLVFVKSA
jgi:ribosomal protein S18 acetylase RimI-like enzyme